MKELETQTLEQLNVDETSYWLRIRRESHISSLQPLEDAAKQIVAITSLLQGVYFAAISISDIKKANTTTDAWFVSFIVLSLVTVAFWMASLFFATRVFVPEVYDASATRSDLSEHVKEIRIAYNKTSTYKFNNLKWAVMLLWVSFFPFAINLFIYLAVLPVPPPE